MIVISVLDLLPVHIDAVVVILGVHDEAAPFTPSRRYVRPVVLVQVFTEVAYNKRYKYFKQCR